MQHDDDLIFRVERLYAAVAATEEPDLTRLKPKMVIQSGMRGFHQDFAGGLNRAQIANLGEGLIYSIAHFGAHLQKWLQDRAGTRREAQKAAHVVRRVRDGSFELRIMMDLADIDKHAFAARRSHSGKFPRLENVRRCLQLTTRPVKGSVVAVVFTPQGIPVPMGDGTAMVVVTGDILDKSGATIGDLHTMAKAAVHAWEVALAEVGIKLEGPVIPPGEETGDGGQCQAAD